MGGEEASLGTVVLAAVLSGIWRTEEHFNVSSARFFVVMSIDPLSKICYFVSVDVLLWA